MLNAAEASGFGFSIPIKKMTSCSRKDSHSSLISPENLPKSTLRVAETRLGTVSPNLLFRT